MPDTCTICQSAVDADASTCACGARRGFKDGKGRIRSRAGFMMIGALCIIVGSGLIYLAQQIPIFFYHYPLMFVGGLMWLGAFIISFQLIRGPRWYPQ